MKIIVVEDGKAYKVKFSQGHQHFTLDFRATKIECKWMKKQLRIAFNSFRKEKHHG